MSGPNPSELGKSQTQENPITRSQVKKNTELAKIAAPNQTGLLKPKKTVTVKEKVNKDNFENISNKDKTNISLQLDNISLEKTITFEQFETVGTSNLSDSNNWLNSISKTNSSIICGSIDQDETLKNETTYTDNEHISLLSSTIIPKNTVEERTKINLSEKCLTRGTISSNHDSDDNSTDNEQMEQIIHNNPEENVNPIRNNEMVLPINQQVSSRDALEVVPLFGGSNIPLSHFIEGCYEAMAMLPASAAQENLARLLRSKLSGEGRKCIFGSTHNNIEE